MARSDLIQYLPLISPQHCYRSHYFYKSFTILYITLHFLAIRLDSISAIDFTATAITFPLWPPNLKLHRPLLFHFHTFFYVELTHFPFLFNCIEGPFKTRFFLLQILIVMMGGWGSQWKSNERRSTYLSSQESRNHCQINQEWAGMGKKAHCICLYMYIINVQSSLSSASSS